MVVHGPLLLDEETGLWHPLLFTDLSADQKKPALTSDLVFKGGQIFLNLASCFQDVFF